MKQLLKDLIRNNVNRVLQKAIRHQLAPQSRRLDFDFDIWRYLAQTGFNPDWIVDVGAARGDWTKSVMSVFPHAHFLMIDPLSENEESLKEMVQKNSALSFWSGLLGSASAEIEMHAHGNQTSIFPSRFGGSIRKVPMRTLDSFFRDGTIPQVDALKLDVQGAEIEVLKGATELIKNCRVVQTEVSFRRIYENAPLAHEVIGWFSQHGFRIYDICAAGRRRDRGLMEADIFFVSDDALIRCEHYDDYVYHNV